MERSSRQQPIPNPKLYLHLTRRESQIMDVVFRLGEVSVADVVEQLPDDPSYNTVRLTMRKLEQRGHLKHREEGQRYLYTPVVTAERAKRSAAQHLLQTFFNGSSAKAMLALLGMSSSDLTEEEVDEITALLEKARKKGQT
jgi:BlaI family transcriptional regulator, penicillinase repressor